MTVRLRAHHLLCLLTYVGEGYSTDFLANLDQVTIRLSAGEEILLGDGPDDICAPLLGADQDHCRRITKSRDREAITALSELLGQDLTAGTRLNLDPSMLERLRQAFASGAIRAACAGCEWADLCTSVAARAYERARL